MNIKIGFADAVHEAVKRGLDDWRLAGWIKEKTGTPFFFGNPFASA